MATPFLSSEEYDERAHRLYDDGAYDSALEMLKEGLRLYPHSVELYVGLGYTRLAREEFVWGKQAFESALVLDPEHEDALVGLGEALLRFGHRSQALSLFTRARDSGCAEDPDLLLSMGRALYRERLYDEARSVFEEAVRVHGDSPEASAALGYTMHRLGDETAARRMLRRALHQDGEHHEARIYLAHLLYDRGDWAGALRELERVPAAEHWDPLALGRLIELKRALGGLPADAPEIGVWEARLAELEAPVDPSDAVLAEIEASIPDRIETAVIVRAPKPRVILPGGASFCGSWFDIVRQIRDASGDGPVTIDQFMRSKADEVRASTGRRIPSNDPREFLLGGARAGVWQIEL